MCNGYLTHMIVTWYLKKTNSFVVYTILNLLPEEEEEEEVVEESDSLFSASSSLDSSPILGKNQKYFFFPTFFQKFVSQNANIAHS